MQNEDNPFTTKVFCAECGSAFGRKNWTTSRGKRKVWQCNNRYKVKGQIGCQNNHIAELIYQECWEYDSFEMCQVLDGILISEDGQMTVRFLEGTEVDL